MATGNQSSAWLTIPPILNYPQQFTLLSETDPAFIPVMLRAMERVRSDYFWEPGDRETANKQISQQEYRLLMDIGEQLIMEIRAARGFVVEPPGMRDRDSDPFGLALYTAATATEATEQNGLKLDTVIAELQGIRADLAADTDTEDIISKLDVLLLLLG